MAASRIAFALADLKSEIDKLRGQPIGQEIELVLDRVSFDAVVREIEHHLGQRLRRHPLFEETTNEMVRFGGMSIESLRPPAPTDLAETSSAAASGGV